MMRRLLALAWIFAKGGDGMDAVYARLIMETDATGWTIDRVPQVFRKKTLSALEVLGLDGYGKPLY